MIINIQCYDRLGSDLVITVSAVDDAGCGVASPAKFVGRAIVPRVGIDLGDLGDVLQVIGEELFNVAGPIVAGAA